MPEGISQEIAEWFERTGLSLTRAGELLDVDRQTLWRWKVGDQVPQHPRMLRLAMARVEDELDGTTAEAQR